jgi:glycosyltransferase involved in cell wall biosynthesis
VSALSGCTLVRNAVKLNYPLEASIQTYYPLCQEVVISYDPNSEDDTEKYVLELARRYPKIRPVPSPWDMKNHRDGTEITIQSNVAVDACTGDWILYVQADEAIHEDDHDLIRSIMEETEINGALFDRRSFLGTLDREIPEYFARNLLRLFRNGRGSVIGDGMTCGLVQGVSPTVPREHLRMFNYSRMGKREEILQRSRYRDHFHHESKEAIEENQGKEFTQTVRPYDPRDHPRSIRDFYSAFAQSGEAVPNEARASRRYPVTLGILLGPRERENLAGFVWPFHPWPGDIVIVDDSGGDGGGELLRGLFGQVQGVPDERVTVLGAQEKGDFAGARNRIQERAGSPWVLMADLDERWNPVLVRELESLTRQLDRDGKRVCGFPRANFLNGVLANDIPPSEWTEGALRAASAKVSWPPQNPDTQYRLLRSQERWVGRLHERPTALSSRPGEVVALRDFWILHSKVLSRQRAQDTYYRSLGQKEGMPSEDTLPEGLVCLRELTLTEVMARLPQKELTIVETGTLRDSSPRARVSDGWSTYTLAQLLAARGPGSGRLYSIDFEPKCLEVSRKTVPEALHPRIRWMEGDAKSLLSSLEVDSIDLLYLDSSDDPRQILSEFEAALPKLKKESIVVVDDTGAYHAGPEGKGTLLLPEARRRGWQVEPRGTRESGMAILTPPL